MECTYALRQYIQHPRYIFLLPMPGCKAGLLHSKLEDMGNHEKYTAIDMDNHDNYTAIAKMPHVIKIRHLKCTGLNWDAITDVM